MRATALASRSHKPRLALLAGLVLATLVALAQPARAVEVERVVSPGGIEAWLVRDRLLPITSIEFSFRGGAAWDPADKAGLSRFAAATLDEGAGPYDSQTFRRLLEDMSVTLSFSAGRDTFRGSFRTLNKYRDDSLELLRLALAEPRFDEEPVERIRAQLRLGLERDRTDPDAIAWRRLYRALFPDHPYGRPVDGDLDTLEAIDAADLHAFARERLGRDRLIVGVVGDVTPEELGPMLDRVFGALPELGPAPPLADPAPGQRGETYVVEAPVPQSVAVFGHGGVTRDDPDYYAAHVLNFILGGGGFVSRLTEEVREKRGLAYSVYSYLMPLDHAGLWVGGVATENARVAESLALIRGEWAKLRAAPPGAQELADAKRYLTGSFALRFSSTSAIARMLVGMQAHDLGIDYIDRRNDYIEAVTPDNLARVARTHLDPEALTVVVVGQPENVTATRDADELGG